DIEADDLTAVGDGVAPVAVDGDRRAQADAFPVAHLPGAAFWNHKLPEKLAGFFVEAHQHAAVSRLGRIAWRLVVRPNVNATTGHHRAPVGLRTELGDP